MPAVDTFTIKSRTFTVTSTTKFTGAATGLADLQIGTKVTGSCLKASDGITAVTVKSAP